MVLVSFLWKSRGKCAVLEILEKWSASSSATIRGSETTSPLMEREGGGGGVYRPESLRIRFQTDAIGVSALILLAYCFHDRRFASFMYRRFFTTAR